MGLAVSALGLALLLAGGREAAGLRARLSPAGLLIGAQHAVASPDGRVLVASKLSRVHVYSAEGRPLRGFEVPASRFRLRVVGADRVWVLPAEGDARAYDLDGNPAPAPTPAELASRAEPTAPDDALRIDGGDVVRATPAGDRVLVRGYTSHTAMLLHALAVGACLFAGGLLLIGGVVATGRRRHA